MKKLIYLFFVILIFSCTSKSKDEKKDNSSGKDYLLQEQSVRKMVSANHDKISKIRGDFQSYKQYLASLDKDSLTSIAYAMDYINTCLAKETANRDSILFLFNVHFSGIVNRFSDSLESRYGEVLAPLAEDSVTPGLSVFKDNLAFCGIGIYSSEGMFYPDMLPDYLYSNFNKRVSEGVAEYLKIRSDEMKEGFAEDAGLLISFEKVYQRVQRWENLVQKYPQNIYKQEAQYYYQTYLETLMTGMDNSRIFDHETGKLLPGIKALYEKIIKEKTDSPSREIIADYYAFLSRHQFKENDSIPAFLEARQLGSMQSVQPHTR